MAFTVREHYYHQESIHRATYDAGYQKGLVGDLTTQPLPVGAILRSDWEDGMRDGYHEFDRLRSLATKGKDRKKPKGATCR